MKNKALKVVQKMLNGALVLTFERWRDHIIEEKQTAMAGAMDRWHEQVVLVRNQRGT